MAVSDGARPAITGTVSVSGPISSIRTARPATAPAGAPSAEVERWERRAADPALISRQFRSGIALWAMQRRRCSVVAGALQHHRDPLLAIRNRCRRHFTLGHGRRRTLVCITHDLAVGDRHGGGLRLLAAPFPAPCAVP